MRLNSSINLATTLVFMHLNGFVNAMYTGSHNNETITRVPTGTGKIENMEK